jgi:putative hydrolase of the HAD superfamily
MAVVSEISTVLFDADGVLQRALPGWLENLAALVPAGRAEEFVTEVMTAERLPLRGEGSFPDELAKVLARWNVTTPLGEVLANWARIEVFPDVLDVVRRLRDAGIGCYLATNQHAFRTAYMRANLGYDELFDDEFYSCELGLAKPDPAYFTTILDRIGRSGPDTLFVDDNPSNVDGARAAGLHAEYFPPEAGAVVLRELLSRYAVPLR